MNKFPYAVAVLLIIASCSAEVSVESTVDESATADTANFGHVDNQLFWTYEQKVAGFRNMEKIGPTRLIPASNEPYPLQRNESDLGSVEFTFDDAVLSIDEYVESQKVAGLIVVKDDVIIYERYELGNTEKSRWVSYSVAKSVTSMLVGADFLTKRRGYSVTLSQEQNDSIQAVV